jgi:DNA-binding response OmpR family regulator
MECRALEVTTNFNSQNMVINHNDDLTEKSLVQKLHNIERCITKRELSHGIDIVRELINELYKYRQPNLKSNKLDFSDMEKIKFGALQIEKKIGRVIHHKQVVDLSTNEFSLLLMLVENPDEIISRDNLHLKLLKNEYDGLNRSIDNTISRIRKKLGDNNLSKIKIKSIRGKGYLFSTEGW